MLRSLTQRRGQCAVLAACASPFLAGRALGGIDFNETDSSVKITHYAERDNAGSFGTKNVNPPPASGSMPVPGSYQYAKTILLNGGSSSASATVGAVTNSQNVGFTFASGTGITQTDPTGTSFSKAAQLKFVLNGEWDVTAGGFGPTAYGYLAFTLGGAIPPGDSASVDINLSWKDAGNNSLRTPISQTISFPSNTLPYAFSNAMKLNTGSVTSGKIKVTGTISFNALDPGATIDLHPTDFELSAAPPTYNFQSKTNNINDAANWTIDSTMAQDFPKPVPNDPGVRAYFGPTSSQSTDVTINAPMTFGMLDINRRGFNISGNSTLTFDTQANNAVLFVRNTNNFTGMFNGSQSTATSSLITAPIVLDKPLEVIVDTEQPAMAGGSISGSGGIIKNGLGNLVLAASNSFTGGITLNAGTLTPTANGALGSNTVTLNGGMIDVQTPQPFAPGGGTIGVQSNGQVNIGMNGVSGVNYNIATFGAISGNAQQLGGLIVGTNFFPKPGSMISHKSFDPTAGSSNPQGLSNVPTYIFGISGDFTSAGQNITVGSASGTPWLGFGGDKAVRVFGSAGSGQSLVISGDAQLVSLGAQLYVGAPVTGAGKIFKNGDGLVRISNAGNTFSGVTEVQSGPMAIDAGWAGPITVDGGAALGGNGTVNAGVSFADNPTKPSLFEPGMLGSVANNASGSGNTTDEGAGTMHTGDITFSPTTHLRYDLNTPGVAGGGDNDLLVIAGNLTLDGILDINGGLEFTNGVYTLMTFTGTATDNGLQFGNVDLQIFPNAQIIIVNNPGGFAPGGGSVLIAVPEPSVIGMLAVVGILARRRRR